MKKSKDLEMSSPIVGAVPSAGMRKKRNFNNLKLDVAQPTQSPASAPVDGVGSGGVGNVPMPTRLAPPPRGKRKPPKMDLSKSSRTNNGNGASNNGSGGPVSATGDEGGSGILLTVGPAGSNSAPATGTPASRPNYQSTLQQQLADLDINGSGEGSTKLDLKSEDLKELSELGQGNGGSVKKVLHIPTGKKMAKKVRAFL